MSTHSRLPHQRAVAHTHTHTHTYRHRLTNTFPYGYTQTHTCIIYECIQRNYTDIYVDVSKNTYACTALVYVCTLTHVLSFTHTHTISLINTHTHTPTKKQLVHKHYSLSFTWVSVGCFFCNLHLPYTAKDVVLIKPDI